MARFSLRSCNYVNEESGCGHEINKTIARIPRLCINFNLIRIMVSVLSIIYPILAKSWARFFICMSIVLK